MAEVISLQKGKTVFAQSSTALVTGSFDILHLGHLRFLSLAKQSVTKKTKLVVVVLGDAEITRRKGPNRPVFKLHERIEALSYLRSVDYIIPWEQPWEELRDFVTINKPAYLALVKGDPGFENKIKHIESVGGKAIVIEPLPGISTSAIINKLDL